MKQKKKVRDRYFDEEMPSNNYDYVENLVEDFGALDQYVYNSPQVQQLLGDSFQVNIPTDKKEKQQKRQKRLLRKVMQAASRCLTDRQFQIFILRFVFNLTQEEIATRVGHDFVGRPRLDKNTKKTNKSTPISQEYVCQVVKTSIKKVQKELRLAEDTSL